MHGVVRFLDTPLLPASSPDDYPKIIKSGIDEEGQHPKSPKITGGHGAVTLLHRVGYPNLVERLLDVDATQEFDFVARAGDSIFQDLYVNRKGRLVEMGFIDTQTGERGYQGVRFHIEREPAGSPYRFGKWTPISTSDLGNPWGGSEVWVRGQGAIVAKGIWYHQIYDRPLISVSWSGMSESEKQELDIWLKERSERLQKKKEKYLENKPKSPSQEDTSRWMKLEELRSMWRHYQLRLACRAECGEKNPKLLCSKCKITRYCSAECQADDWKYHKTYCGTEERIPPEYIGPIEVCDEILTKRFHA